MPELPEVEWARRCLEKWLSRKNVMLAEAAPSRIFRQSSLEGFKALRGRVSKIERRGKYLMLSFQSGQGLLSHLGMTGKWLRAAKGDSVTWSRAELHLDSDEVLHYVDPRMFGRLQVTQASALKSLPEVAQLGPDLLLEKMTPEGLQKALGASPRAIKVALMDQQRLAGLGNIHAQEALFRARIHPKKAVRALTGKEWAQLATAIDEALAFALHQPDGEMMSYVQDKGAENPFLVYGKAKSPCPRCQTLLKLCIQGGRSTHFCPQCQKMRSV